MKKPKREPLAVREAVVTACSALLFNSGLTPQRPSDQFVLRGVLNHLVWYYSETHDNGTKYIGCPNWSQKALDRYYQGRGWRKDVALEHVVPRKQLISELLQARTKEDICGVLARSETCVILRCEHKDLRSDKEGWERYDGVVNVVRGIKLRTENG